MVDRGNGILYLFVSGFFIGVGSESKDFVPWPAALWPIYYWSPTDRTWTNTSDGTINPTNNT